MNKGKTREELISDARRIKTEIDQIFVDAEYWNANVRKPEMAIVDPDPFGQLTRIRAGIVKMLKAEDSNG